MSESQQMQWLSNLINESFVSIINAKCTEIITSAQYSLSSRVKAQFSVSVYFSKVLSMSSSNLVSGCDRSFLNAFDTTSFSDSFIPTSSTSIHACSINSMKQPISENTIHSQKTCTWKSWILEYP